MKALKFLTVALIILSTFAVQAQVSQDSRDGDDEKTNVSVSSNLPMNPKTKTKFRYYYFPNMRAYYDNLNKVFYFRLNGEWKSADKLPCLYGGYSMYKNRKVIIDDFINDKPYEFFSVHQAKYPYDAKGRLYQEVNS